MRKLPARTGADVHLAEAFSLPGCPLCRERSRTEAAYLESILAESVNDIGFRQGLDVARGFCGAHCRAVLAADRRSSGSLGAAILLRATLVARLRDMEEVHGSGSWTRARRAGEAARPAACLACQRVRATDDGVVDGLVQLAEHPAWAEAAAAAPFCLEHVLLLMNRRAAPAWWTPVEASQLERLRRIRDLLGGFAHTSSQDRRHLRTDEQTRSVEEAADLLGGWGIGDRPKA
ncbi:MAG: DUF6062 family protein [Chloroflexota bacterium]